MNNVKYYKWVAIAVAVLMACILGCAFYFAFVRQQKYQRFASESSFYENMNTTITWQQFQDVIPHIRQSKSIPRVFYRTGPFNLEDAPPQVLNVLHKTLALNPGFVQVYFDDSDIEDFLHTYAPECATAYHSIIPGAFKCDIARLAIIYQFGGIYNDLGHMYNCPIADIFDTVSDEFVSAIDCDDWSIYQGIIAAYPFHPLVRKMLDAACANVERKHYGAAAIDVTGPMAIARVFNLFFGMEEEAKGKPGKQVYIKNNKKYKIFLLKFRVDNNKAHRVVNINDDDNAIPKIWTKFPDYYDIVYKNRKIKYYIDMWKEREIFYET